MLSAGGHVKVQEEEEEEGEKYEAAVAKWRKSEFRRFFKSSHSFTRPFASVFQGTNLLSAGYPPRSSSPDEEAALLTSSSPPPSRSETCEECGNFEEDSSSTDNVCTYLDYAGSPPYPESLIKRFSSLLSESILTNPHSHPHQNEMLDAIRLCVLQFVNADPCMYTVTFMSSATEVLKTIAMCFDWTIGDVFAYTSECHSSVLGMRKIAADAGATICSVSLTEEEKWSNLLCSNYISSRIVDGFPSSCYKDPDGKANRVKKKDGVKRKGLFAVTGESNFSGIRPRLEYLRPLRKYRNNEINQEEKSALLEEEEEPRNGVVEKKLRGEGMTEVYQGSRNINCINDNNIETNYNKTQDMKGDHETDEGDGDVLSWYILLDAAKLASSKLDLSKNEYVDFTVISFYKMFGFPTGLAALITRHDAIHTLKTKYYGGGSVKAISSSSSFFVPKDNFVERFEIGTPNFLSILSLPLAIDSMYKEIPRNALAAHAQYVTHFAFKSMQAMCHYNGMPLCVIYGMHTHPQWKERQGPTIAFLLKKCDGSYISSYAVYTLALQHNIVLRVGCHCNIGGCEAFLNISDSDIRHNYTEGHSCGDDVDFVDGKPTGCIRISFGYASTKVDVYRFFSFLKNNFLSSSVSAIRSQSSSAAAEAAATDIHNADVPSSLNSQPQSSSHRKPLADFSTYAQQNLLRSVETDNKRELPSICADAAFTTSVRSEGQLPPSYTQQPYLEDIYFYPIKGCRGVRTDSWLLDSAALCLLWDRRFCLQTNIPGRIKQTILNQKSYPNLSAVRVDICLVVRGGGVGEKGEQTAHPSQQSYFNNTEKKPTHNIHDDDDFDAEIVMVLTVDKLLPYNEDNSTSNIVVSHKKDKGKNEGDICKDNNNNNNSMTDNSSSKHAATQEADNAENQSISFSNAPSVFIPLVTYTQWRNELSYIDRCKIKECFLRAVSRYPSEETKEKKNGFIIKNKEQNIQDENKQEEGTKSGKETAKSSVFNMSYKFVHAQDGFRNICIECFKQFISLRKTCNTPNVYTSHADLREDQNEKHISFSSLKKHDMWILAYEDFELMKGTYTAEEKHVISSSSTKQVMPSDDSERETEHHSVFSSSFCDTHEIGHAYTAHVFTGSVEEWFRQYVLFTQENIKWMDSQDKNACEHVNGDAASAKLKEMKTRCTKEKKDENKIKAFVNSSSFLLICGESLKYMEKSLGQKMEAERFRANFIVKGFEALSEKKWKTVKIGHNRFSVEKECVRCTSINVDPNSGEYTPNVLRGLATVCSSLSTKESSHGNNPVTDTHTDKNALLQKQSNKAPSFGILLKCDDFNNCIDGPDSNSNRKTERNHTHYNTDHNSCNVNNLLEIASRFAIISKNDCVSAS